MNEMRENDALLLSTEVKVLRSLPCIRYRAKKSWPQIAKANAELNQKAWRSGLSSAKILHHKPSILPTTRFQSSPRSSQAPQPLLQSFLSTYLILYVQFFFSASC